MTMRIRAGAGDATDQLLADFQPGGVGTDRFQGIVPCTAAGQPIDALTAAPTGTERALVTRPIPSGLQHVLLPDFAPPTQDVLMTGLNNAATFDVTNYATVAVQLTGTFTGTLVMEASLDGTNYVQVNGLNNGGGRSATIGSGTIMRIAVSSFMYLRFRVWSATSGTATVAVRDSATEALFNVVEPVSARGIQHSNAVQTHDMKDTGRTPVLIHAEAVAGVTTDTLIPFVKVTGGTTAAAATSISPTTNKILRLTDMTITMVSTGTAILNARLRGRYNPSGAAIVTSAVQGINNRVGFTTAPVAGSVLNPAMSDFIDGLEIPSGAGFGMTHIGSAATYTLDISIFGFEY